jgi:ribonuclease P protein component
LVVHALNSVASDGSVDNRAAGPVTLPTRAAGSTARVGFVVSKAVGNSVVRHRVSRRLRHLMADRIGTLPTSYTLVVRALPSSAGASSSELGADLDGALRRLSLGGDVV